MKQQIIYIVLLIYLLCERKKEIFCKLLLLKIDTKYLDNKTTTIIREVLRQYLPNKGENVGITLLYLCFFIQYPGHLFL